MNVLVLVKINTETAREIFCMLLLEAVGIKMYARRTREMQSMEVNAIASTARYFDIKDGNIVSKVKVAIGQGLGCVGVP